MKSRKIYKIILIILIFIMISIVTVLIFKYINNIQNTKKMQTISKTYVEEDTFEKPNKKIEQIEGYKIIGVIQIEKINLEYPILEINNEKTMKISITKFWGNNINENGNITLAGHNNFDGTMFGKLKKLKIDDEVKLTDLKQNTITYKIYNIYITNPDDITIVNGNDKSKEVTLVTCSNGRKSRLIIKAKSK